MALSQGYVMDDKALILAFAVGISHLTGVNNWQVLGTGRLQAGFSALRMASPEFSAYLDFKLIWR